MVCHIVFSRMRKYCRPTKISIRVLPILDKFVDAILMDIFKDIFVKYNTEIIEFKKTMIYIKTTDKTAQSDQCTERKRLKQTQHIQTIEGFSRDIETVCNNMKIKFKNDIVVEEPMSLKKTRTRTCIYELNTRYGAYVIVPKSTLNILIPMVHTVILMALGTVLQKCISSKRKVITPTLLNIVLQKVYKKHIVSLEFGQ